MDQINITCEETRKTLRADVLKASKNSFKVAVVGTNLVIELHRQGNEFEGKAAGLTFVSDGLIL